MIHTLKTTPKYFKDAVSGRKPFEVRRNDRAFKEGDYLELKEYEPNPIIGIIGKYTYSGRYGIFKITYVLNDTRYCKKGYVVLGIKPYDTKLLKVHGRKCGCCKTYEPNADNFVKGICMIDREDTGMNDLCDKHQCVKRGCFCK